MYLMKKYVVMFPVPIYLEHNILLRHTGMIKSVAKTYNLLLSHSSEIKRFALLTLKCSRETLQNLAYFCVKKTHVVFFVFHFNQLYIFTYSSVLNERIVLMNV